MSEALDREAVHRAWLEREGLNERPISVAITDTKTGQTRAGIGMTGIFEGDEFQDYSWCDGNYACDCNRGQFFAEACGVDVEAIADDEPDPFPCGDERYTVRITDESGALLYEDYQDDA